MREILFRGKDIETNEWRYSMTIAKQVYEGNDVYTYYIGHDHNAVVYGSTVGQYTGLDDRNGKRIFEGDIVRLCRATHPIIVFWDGLGWKFKRADGKLVKGAFESDIIHDIEICEVIGNIYDNPELLEKE